MPVIEVKNIRKYYGDVRGGVENLSFEVEEGEIYGFLGPNGGAGKTTTVKILVKIIRDYEGTAKVLGKDLREWGARTTTTESVSHSSFQRFTPA